MTLLSFRGLRLQRAAAYVGQTGNATSTDIVLAPQEAFCELALAIRPLYRDHNETLSKAHNRSSVHASSCASATLTTCTGARGPGLQTAAATTVAKQLAMAVAMHTSDTAWCRGTQPAGMHAVVAAAAVAATAVAAWSALFALPLCTHTCTHSASCRLLDAQHMQVGSSSRQSILLPSRTATVAAAAAAAVLTAAAAAVSAFPVFSPLTVCGEDVYRRCDSVCRCRSTEITQSFIFLSYSSTNRRCT